MFRQKRPSRPNNNNNNKNPMSSAPSATSTIDKSLPSSPSIFSSNSSTNSLSASSSGSRSQRNSETDTLITFSSQSFKKKADVVFNDEELLNSINLRPARFNIINLADTSDGRSPNVDTPSDEASKEGLKFNQAGGHNGMFEMREHGSQLIKKAPDREARFYELAQKGEWPVRFLPQYFGRVGDKISLENLIAGYKKPCVVDIKMGYQTFENDEKSLLKRLKMHTIDQLTGSKSEGCRIEGLSMYRSIDKRMVNLRGNKRKTHILSMDMRISLKDMLTFFLTDEFGVRTDIALRFQLILQQLLDHFEKNNDTFWFIGSSILLIYDNDNQEPHMKWLRALRNLHHINPNIKLSEDQISGLTRKSKCDVKMIDFAHTGPLPANQKKDLGYIKGLKSIINALKEIRAYRTKHIFSFHSAAIDMMEEERAKNLKAAQSEGSTPQKDFTFGTVLKQLTAVSQVAHCHAEDEAEQCSVISNEST